MEIRKITGSKRDYIDLLLLADESEEMIDQYLERGEMYILKVENREEAKKLCDREPLVVGGYATYKLIDFVIANRENNYLL